MQKSFFQYTKDYHKEQGMVDETKTNADYSCAIVGF